MYWRDMDWHILIVGVNHAVDRRKRLRYAEESAKKLHDWMTARLDAKLCGIHPCLLSPDLQQVNDALSWLSRARNRILIWTGHAEYVVADHYLVTGNTTANEIGRMLSFSNLRQCLATSQASSTTAVFLDTCYSGDLELPPMRDDSARGASLIVASALPAEPAIERGIEQGIAAVVREVLERCADDAGRRGSRALDLAEVWGGAVRQLRSDGRNPTVSSREQGAGASPLPLARQASGRRMGSLEQALGFATQAFRDYLERNVVRGVEVIYFLGYDPWDGCLIYDGLVPGSIEQTLLNSVRRCFLDRDRLRSRFQENRNTSKLGPAGQCYKQALADCSASSAPATRLETASVFIGAPWFIGDLNAPRHESSEFRAYDSLLGLTCCLYLPIIIKTPTEPEPIGGVIMAAASQAWELVPQVDGGAGVMAAARLLPERQQATEEIQIAGAICEALQLPRHLDDEGPQQKMDDFVRCIAAVYQERSAQRWRIRKAVHPVTPKRVARLLRDRHAEPSAERSQVVTAISALIARRMTGRDRELPNHPADRARMRGEALVRWVRDLRTHGVDLYLPVDDGSRMPEQRRRELLRTYLAIYLWRELTLMLRNAAAGRSERELAEHVLKREPLEFLNDTTLDIWVNDRAFGRAERRPVPDGHHDASGSNPSGIGIAPERERSYRTPGDVRAFQRDAIDDLIDGLRESDGSVFETLMSFLDQHGPVNKYVRGILGLQAILDVDDQHRLLEDLAHTVQVYLLGLWLMFTRDLDNNQIASDAAEHIIRFFQVNDEANARPEVLHLQDRLRELPEVERDVGLIRTRPLPLASLAPPDVFDELSLAWGLSASMHDIGLPLQRFEQWGRRFFERYFGLGAGRWAAPSGLTEIFLHPRFPVYKNAIISLHHDRHIRHWLDSLFCRQMTGGIQHGFAGSLILASELEPDGNYAPALKGPQLWIRLPRRLERIYGTVGIEDTVPPWAIQDQDRIHLRRRHLEQELVLPAYLAHAVALSHVDHDSEDYGPIDGSDLGDLTRMLPDRPPAPSTAAPIASPRPGRRYFEDIRSDFHIQFSDFPITWLLAVCNVLAVPTTEFDEFCAALRGPGDQPLVRIEGSALPDRHGASPFFVRRIEATSERTLRILLAPWRVFTDLTWSAEPPRAVPWDRVETLLRAWQDTIRGDKPDGDYEPTTWFLYADSAYDEYLAKIAAEDQIAVIDTPRHPGTDIPFCRERVTWIERTADDAERVRTMSRMRYSQPDGEPETKWSKRWRERHVRRSTFEIVHMLYLLAKLHGVYCNSQWHLYAEFINMRGRTFRVGG